MLSNLLAAVEGYPQKISIGDAALTALIGFIVVFIGIAFLIFIVWLIGKIMQMGEKKGSKPEKTAQKQVETPKPKKVAPVEKTAVEEEIPEETVAVITAAIMAYYQKNNPKCEFTVKRIKRF